jgi:tRNA threonylcarbamoyladenosine biosynthesis protein TsaB
MRLLGIDTATEACTVALWVDGEVRERFEHAPQGHASLVLPMADALLAEAGLRPAALDAVAVGRGPGSFTGVRIGIGVAQGVAFAAGLPVVPVSTPFTRRATETPTRPPARLSTTASKRKARKMEKGRKPTESRMPMSWERAERAASIVFVAVKTAAIPMMMARK